MQIVSGGGWKDTQVLRVRVKAWIALLLATGLGVVTILSAGSVLVYACIPAVVCLIVSVVLFIRERPVQFETFTHRVGGDPRNLHGCCGNGMNKIHRNSEEQHAGHRSRNRNPNSEGSSGDSSFT